MRADTRMATHQTPNPYAAAVAPRPPPRQRRGWRIAGWTIAALFALLAVVLGGAWWWAGSDTSLAAALSRAARYLPPGQTLESRDVTGSLRGGGRIGWLRWSSPGLAVEVDDARIGWRLAPLVLGRRVQLGEVHAARVQMIPQATEKAAGPVQPLQSLPLPVQVDLPFRIDQLVWSPPTSKPLHIAQLAGRYDYDGSRHQLVIENIDIAQGSYFGRATLGAQAPMPLDAQLNGKVRTAPPGGGAELEATVHATVQGTLATEAARLQVAAQLRSSLGDGDAAPPASAAAARAAEPAPRKDRSSRKTATAAAPVLPAEPMQADVQAQIAPWAPQPLLQAQAALRALDLAAIWPQAPVTRLSGEVRAEPTAATSAGPAVGNAAAAAATGWNISAQLKNALPGPWDRQRLPAGTIEARAAFDGTQWTVPQAAITVGENQGRLEAEGTYTPATRALQGRVKLRDLRPDAVYSTLDRAPLSGTATARGDDDGLIRFTADVRSATAAAARTGGRPAGTAPLRIDRLAAEGSWRDGRLDLARLQLDGLQAQISARQVQIDTAGLSGRGQLQATVPGASLQANGQMAPRSGAGTMDLKVADAQRLQRWIETLPGGAGALQGALLEGNATLATRWNGGWQTLQRQLHAAGLLGGAAPEGGAGGSGFTLQAQLDTPRLKADLPPRPGTNTGPQSLQLTDVQANLSGSLQQFTLAWDGHLRQGEQRATLRLRAGGGHAGAPGNWRAQIGELRVVASIDKQPGPWTLQLAQPLSVTARQKPTLLIETSAGGASVTGPLPGTARLNWQPVRFAQTAKGGVQLRTQGELQGLPTSWADAFAGNDGPWLQRLGLSSNVVLGGEWSIDLGDTLRASATVRRASGDLRILAGDIGSVPSTVVVRSSGQGAGKGAAQVGDGSGTMAGIRQAEMRIDAEGDAVRARLLWDSERAGRLQADGGTRLARGTDGGWLWPVDAPLAATVKAQLPDVGVWSALAPPGWRVKGTLQADATLSGTRTAPRWNGTLGADQMAVRSLLDGVDLQDGRMRAVLRGDRLEITEFRVNGGQGSNARIPGFSGNLTPAPTSGGTLTGTGTVSWAGAQGGAAGGSGIAMDFNAQARALQVLVRADRQVSISGNVQTRLQNGQLTLRGKLTTDRATIILPEAGAPTLGSDVVVRSAAKDREAMAQALKAAQAEARVEATRPPDIAITLDLGNDFALQGYGITTRLAGDLDIRSTSTSTAGAPPRVTGEIRTVQGRYRAWGQSLDVETGLLRFNGPYDNPALDVLAIRPNISVRAGVQVSGTAKMPRVRLYSDPDLPDAEKLSWVVLGRSAAAGGAEAALLQQAALALLSGNGDGGSGNFARRLGLDEIGFRGPGSGEDASGAALTFGKRLSKDLYVTYERSLSGALGTLYIFYDLSRRLTLRGQTGAQSAVDLIYTLRYN